MKKLTRILKFLILWGACGLVLPFSLVAFLFQWIFAGFAAISSIALVIVLSKKVAAIGRMPVAVKVLFCELVLLLVAGGYYTSDRRASECNFEPGPRVRPIITYADCMEKPGGTDARSNCLAVVDNPYDMELYKGQLLVVSGRDNSVLGRLNPDRPGEVSVEDLGYGNVQQIVVYEEQGRAVLTMWKQRRITIYDLEKKTPIKIFETDVSKLLGAERYGDLVYVISELPYMYIVDPIKETMEKHELGLRFHTLYDIKIDDAGKWIYMSDWVWGLIYKMDRESLKLDRFRYPGIVSPAMGLDRGECELFVSRPLHARVDVMDCNTLETKRELACGIGPHEMTFVPGDRLYVGRYFAGLLLEMNKKTGEITAEMQVGKSTRAVEYDAETGRLYVASKCGVFEIVDK